MPVARRSCEHVANVAFEGSTLWRLRQKVDTDLVLWPGASVVVVRDDDRVLLGRRLDNDMWAIPGGGAEAGSVSPTPRSPSCVRKPASTPTKRTSMRSASISRVENHLVSYPNGDVTHYFGIWFALRRWRGEPAGDGKDMGEVIWADLDDLPRPLLGSTLAGFDLYRAWLDTGRFRAYGSAPQGPCRRGHRGAAKAPHAR